MTNTESPALTFAEVDRPITTRPAEPNPFDAVFPVPDGKAVTLTLPYKTDDDKTAVRKLINQARRKAAALNLSVRTPVTEDKGPKGGSLGTATVTFWTIPKIERKRATDDAADETTNDETAPENPDKSTATDETAVLS